MIIGGEGPDPLPEDVIEIDDKLADLGVPVLQRPREAARMWADMHGNIMLLLTKEEVFGRAYRQLHPSVPFDSASFLTLCVSARGVSYTIRPPIVFGEGSINPVKCTSITEQEITRLWHRHPSDFWELHWQSLDAIDLFMALMNFHPKSAAARNMMRTAVNQLTASSRQLVACEIDSSIPQGVVMACELAGKAVLLHVGADEKLLRSCGHNLSALVTEVSRRAESPMDMIVAEVVLSLPPYVSARYDAPEMTMLDAQNLFRRAMFVTADLLRRTNHDQVYWRSVIDPSIPSRSLS